MNNYYNRSHCNSLAESEDIFKGNSLLYFLNTPLCVKVNYNVSLQFTFTQFGVKINSKQKWS